MSVIPGRIQSDGYSYSDTLWSPSGTWSYEEAVENDDDTISARNYFEDGTVWENGTQLPNYTIKATPNRIGDTKLDDTPIEKSLAALRIYAERVPHQSFLDFLVTNHIAFADPREVIDTTGAVNVKDYGAVGDGITNDQPAFQAAFDDVGVTKVYIPAGTYLMGEFQPGNFSGAVYPSKIELIYGEGKLIVDPESTVLYPIKATTYESFDGLVIDGLSLENGQLYFNTANSNYHNVTIQNCHFENVAVNGIWDVEQVGGVNFVGQALENIVGAKVLNNTFVNHSGGALAFISFYEANIGIRPSRDAIYNITISGNTFTFDAAVAPAKPAWNIAISMASMVSRSTIEHNTISGYEWGLELAMVDTILVRHNHIEAKVTGISNSSGSIDNIIEYNYAQGDSHSILMADAENEIIRHNTLVEIVSVTKNGDGPVIFYPSVTINNNHIVATVDYAVGILAFPDAVVEDNYIESETHEGVMLYYDGSTDAIIDRNTFFVPNNNNVLNNSGNPLGSYEDNIDATEKEISSLVLPKMFK